MDNISYNTSGYISLGWTTLVIIHLGISLWDANMDNISYNTSGYISLGWTTLVIIHLGISLWDGQH